MTVQISCGQENSLKQRDVGGPCEGCEALLEYEDKHLNSVDTLPLFEQSSEQIKLTGTIYQPDGKTPASDVIMYIYQTNEAGIYPKKGNETNWASRHGYIRGWIKTDKSGKYTFYTFRPASYPNTTVAQHIHVTVKEPDTNAYYIDEYQFEDDPNYSARNKTAQRGGNGLVALKKQEGLLIAERDIILGKNIPNY
ncbi:intradiol ring-cleavage dioxygenase [Fulvivirga aurantia]|uniref:dioxygenase family protein n=1 Tax=Fulvivirga aurantia TaxID=2529383 RepID=UPI001FE8D09C|nr:intradiol ring-cleavage dioxygenase [Fulvivirga aurantia]